MSVYYITVFLIIVLCMLAQYTDLKKVHIDLKGRYRHSKTAMCYYLVASSVLIFIAGTRYGVGTDFFAYYKNVIVTVSELYERLKTLNEPGFYLINWIVVRLGGNGATVIFISSLITVGLFVYTIYRNTDRFLLATLLFVFVGCWHGSFNGVRQYLAAAIVFSGVPFIKQRKFVQYCLVVGLAFLFHSSAILMLFAYFIAHNKINLRNIALMIIGSLIILSSFEQIMEGTAILMNAEYSKADPYLTSSVNALRIIVAIVPAVFFLIMYGRKKLINEQKIWMNCLILNAVMMFATSNSTYLARMGIYTSPFLTLAIPELLKGLKYNNRKMLSIIIPLAYALFWWYEVSQSGSLNNFKFVWSS